MAEATRRGLRVPGGCDPPQAAAAQQQRQRQQFEAQLRVSSGDEALDVWDKYVAWSLQVSPGVQAEQGGLRALLERAVMQFARHKAYFSDPRYVNLWIKLAQHSAAPADMFHYMETMAVGQSHAAVYVAWAQHLQAQGDLQQAERVLRQGLSRDAQPPGSLQQALQCVHAGVARSDVGSPPRANKVDLRPRGRKRLAESVGCPVTPMPQPPGGARCGQSLPLMGRSGAMAQEGPRSARSPVGDPRGDTGPPAQPPATSCDTDMSTCEDGGEAGGPDTGGEEAEGSRVEQAMYLKEELNAGAEPLSIEELRAQCYARRQRQLVTENVRQMSDLEEKLKQEVEEKEKQLLLRRSQATSLDQMDEGGSRGGTNGSRKRPAFCVFSDPSSGSASTKPDGRAGRPSPSSLHDDVFLRPGEKGLSIKIQIPAAKNSRQMSDLEEKLEQEVEEKERLLLLRRSQATSLDQVDEGGARGGAGGVADDTRKRPAAKPFHIFSDPSSVSASAKPDGARRPSPNPPHNDVFLRPGEKGPSVKIQFPAPGGATATENARAVMRATPPALSEAVVGGIQNKTLCPSPDNTRDFAPSAHLMSTPCVQRAGAVATPTACPVTGGLASGVPATGGLASGVPATGVPATGVQATGVPATGVQATRVQATGVQGERPLLTDPCSAEARRRVLEQAEVSSFPGYHTVGAPLPHLDQDSQLSLGSQVVFLHTTLQEEERFSVFSGLSQGTHVVLKVERSLLPWDFYVVSQLRKRLGPDSAPLPQVRCFLFLDGCVTLYTLPQRQRLSGWVAPGQEEGVADVVSSLLLMMRTFHSSSLLLGPLHMDSRLLAYGDSGEALLCVDLLSSLDLQLQADLTSAGRLPAALRFIQRGVLKSGDSPYRADLLWLAEAVHRLLTGRKAMTLVEEEDGWMVEQPQGGKNTARFGRKSPWRKLFHLLLNSSADSASSSVSVLSRLPELPVV